MDKLEILLDMIEHPERYTEQQITDLLANEEMRKHYDVMVRLRGAYDVKKEEDPPLTLPVREGVVTFEGEATIQTKHSTPSIQLDPKGSLKTKDSVSAEKTLMFNKGNSYSSLFTFHSSLRKISAIFIAAALLGGLAWALVPRFLSPKNHVPLSTEVTTLPLEGERGGGLLSFSNLPLDSILAVVSAHYNCEVCFRDSAAMGMKFITTWNPEDSLAAFIEHLNMFDGLRLTLQDDTIFVESTNDEEGAQ